MSQPEGVIPTTEIAYREILRVTPTAIDDVNAFTSQAFQTRGGRIGSGLGGVIESLWGFYANKRLLAEVIPVELAWIANHEYNDFAAIIRDYDWHPDIAGGELLRVEVKSTVRSADEPKAHFDRLRKELQATDILAVFVWDWVSVSETSKRSYPKILDFFVGNALEVGELRDALHLARGGSFVTSDSCPDRCVARPCQHEGEPLNKAKIRERKTGPMASRGDKVSFMANYGGLKRMLGLRGDEATAVYASFKNAGSDASKYIQFYERNFK
jgi:hypothetical protein